MMKKFSTVIFIILFISIYISFSGCKKNREESSVIGIAVEFTDHAASAYVAKHKGWFKEEGLNPVFYSYVTGMSLAASLARGDIKAAYLCLLPAINTYANGGISIKIVAGTHRHGYGLAVDTDKIKSVKDLENADIRIASNRTGGPADAILLATIEKYGLNRSKILKKVQRMNPPMQIMAIRQGKIDASFNCEHWPAMAEDAGFSILLTSKDVWPDMQGSVLIVKKDLLDNHPETVEKLVRITRKSIDWIKKNPEEAASIISKELQMTGVSDITLDLPANDNGIEINQNTIFRSMGRLENSIEIDLEEIQKAINFAQEHGYIRNKFKAEDILDLRFIQ